MERPFRRVRLLSLILLSAVVASGARAAAIEKKDQIQVAALALPGGPKRMAAVGFVSDQRRQKVRRGFSTGAAHSSVRLFSIPVISSFNAPAKSLT